MLGPSSLALLALIPSLASARLPPTPSTFPHDYPGKPTGDFSPEWQQCKPLNVSVSPRPVSLISPLCPDFEVTDPLPNVTWSLSRNFAGNIPVNRPGHPNNTLFFWGWEQERGSLTADANERTDVPWAIWLNGG